MDLGILMKLSGFILNSLKSVAASIKTKSLAAGNQAASDGAHYED